ncbi:type IV secretory system conjugative DNA transfer family protein [Thiovibrio frasassiensis]|uniref:Type IV secretory system conjugative DNA transfer family protein n=1 Tax=Thiovibrio frasassiensis TaxID=2984131 RepID=A0A9X4RL77_9BACT|nr:type IV secretory system conjugative DNA transfer family protein [Thiovibrio frasassiensis]MDG4475389.1 type IV secretory system conjugative DNA transfer family protein [Thiovibrio frasassiensis]
MNSKFIGITIMLALGLVFFIPAILIDSWFQGIEHFNYGDDFDAWEVWFYTRDIFFDAGVAIKWRLYLFCFKYAPYAYTACVTVGGAVLYHKNRQALIKAKISATWAKKSDLKEFLGKDGVKLTQNIRLNENTCYGHLLIVGPTGSGKTVSYFLPNLFLLDPRYSAVVTDPKGELYQQTSAYLRAHGWKTKLLKLDNKDVSENWNPLDLPTDETMMLKVCQSIMANASGDHGAGANEMFVKAANNMLLAMIYIVKVLPERSGSGVDGSYGNLRNVAELASTLSFEAIVGLTEYAAAKLKNDSLLNRVAKFRPGRGEESTNNSVSFVLGPALEPFMNDDITKITAQTTFDFTELKSAEHPTVLFVSVPEHKVSAVKAVLATLYMQIFDALLEFGPSGHPVFFFLDEFANIGKVVGFPQYIATIRSRKLSVSVCLQSIEQLERVYGESEKKEILNNLKTQLILPGLKEDESLSYFSKISGDVSYMEREEADGSLRVHSKERLPIHEIRGLEDNADKKLHEAIVFCQNKNAFKDRQCRSYLDSEVSSKMRQYGTTPFPTLPADYYERVAESCFLSPSMKELLDKIGMYILYRGDVKNIPADYKERSQAKMQDFISVVGRPTIERSGTDIAVIWNPHATSLEGIYAQQIISTAFEYLTKQNLM